MQLLICNMQLYRALHGYFIAGQTMSCFPLPIQQRPFYIIFWQRNIPILPFPLISHNWRVMGLAQKWSITTAGSNTKTFENHCATCPRNSSSMYFSQARTIFFPQLSMPVQICPCISRYLRMLVFMTGIIDCSGSFFHSLTSAGEKYFAHISMSITGYF